MAKSYYCACLFYFIFFVVALAQFGVVAGAPLLGGKTLVIGVPKKSGFNQFVDIVKLNSSTNEVNVTGYSIDVFEAAVAHLQSNGTYNVSYKFEAFVNETGQSNGTYNQLLEQIPLKYDAVVGDITIVARRSTYVDFALPYVESGVRMLVQVQHYRHLNMWIFLKPFSWDLWLSIILFCVFIGVTILFMERNANREAGFHDSASREKLTGASVLWFPLAQLVLPERMSVAKKCSRFVLMVWLALAFVLMQSYTASLSSILTVDQLQPSYPSLNSLKRNGENVGYQKDSFVRDLLVERLQFDKSRLREYSTIEQYQEALKIGTRNGGVAAIFDEVSYLKVFLKEYGSKHMIAGPTYRTDGFGFAFPRDSNLTSYFSRAILNVTQGETMDQIEQKYFGISYDDLQDQYDKLSGESPSLTTYSFAGLFMITGSLILLALLVSESCIWQKPFMLAKTYSQRYLFSSRSKETNQSEDGSTNGRDVGSTNEGNNHPESHSIYPSLPV